MEKQELWEEQLKKFEEVYLSTEVRSEFKEYIKQRGMMSAESFMPRKAQELTTFSNNLQYHLNGRSILGIKRKWKTEKDGIVHGCSVNSGLIQSDHSAWMLGGGSLEKTFVKAKSKDEMLAIARDLLDLSNEEMARRFSLMSAQVDVATLFNAVVLDPIIDEEIKRGNFAEYSHCWNDSNHIALSTNESENFYRIGLRHDSRDKYEPNKTMELEFPNGESIVFIQHFNKEKGELEYTIDDVSTEIIEVKGKSKLLQRTVAQIERFAERERQPEEFDKFEKATYNNAIVFKENEPKTEKSEAYADKRMPLLEMVREYSRLQNPNESLDIEKKERVHQLEDEIENYCIENGIIEESEIKKSAILSYILQCYGDNLKSLTNDDVKDLLLPFGYTKVGSHYELSYTGDDQKVWSSTQGILFYGDGTIPLTYGMFPNGDEWTYNIIQGLSENDIEKREKIRTQIQNIANESQKKFRRAMVIGNDVVLYYGGIDDKIAYSLNDDGELELSEIGNLRRITDDMSELGKDNEQSPLQQREAELESLEAEERTITEAEALIGQQKEGQDLGEK